MRERVVRVSATRVLVHEWGRTRGRPVVFWHGLGDHTGLQAIEIAPMLARRGLRVLAPDAPGFGGSQRLPRASDYRLPRLGEWATLLLDALGLERPAWLGASWGAAVGTHLAAARPERLSAVALLDGGYHDLPLPERLPALRAHWRGQPGFRYASWDHLFAECADFFGRWSPALGQAAGSAFEERDGQIVSRMGPDLYAEAIWAMQSPPPSAALAGLAATRLPVLLLAATEPPSESREPALDHFRSVVSHADVRVLPGSHHWLTEEVPEQVAELVGTWLTAETP